MNINFHIWSRRSQENLEAFVREKLNVRFLAPQQTDALQI